MHPTSTTTQLTFHYDAAFASLATVLCYGSVVMAIHGTASGHSIHGSIHSIHSTSCCCGATASVHSLLLVPAAGTACLPVC